MQALVADGTGESLGQQAIMSCCQHLSIVLAFMHVVLADGQQDAHCSQYTPSPGQLSPACNSLPFMQGAARWAARVAAQPHSTDCVQISVLSCRHWWQVGSGKPTARAGHQKILDQMELGLSVEQIAHFRAFVASHNSKILLSSSEAHTKALDVVDAIVANLGEHCLTSLCEAVIIGGC